MIMVLQSHWVSSLKWGLTHDSRKMATDAWGCKLLIMVNLTNLVILVVIKLASGGPIWQIRNAPLAVVGGLLF